MLCVVCCLLCVVCWLLNGVLQIVRCVLFVAVCCRDHCSLRFAVVHYVLLFAGWRVLCVVFALCNSSYDV